MRLSTTIPKNNSLFLGLLFAAMLIPVLGAAQDSLSVDEQYKKARETAFEQNDYVKARRIAYRALERSPDYYGIRIFVANLFAWEEQYKDARKELRYVLDRDPDNRRALRAMIKVERWAGRYESALQWANKALEHFPRDEEFMLAKASVHEKMGNYDAAKQTYKTAEKIYGNRKARQRLQKLRFKQMKYSATLSYRHDQFEDIFDPWNFWEFQLSRQTQYGSVIGRLQYANRFSTGGVQFNVDAYPSLFKGMYAYISGGYSEASIYPRYRFGASLYKSLPAAFELEGGIRWLDFSTSQTTIYTLSLTKYQGSYMFTARTYLVPSSAGSSQSLSLLARRYFSNARTYLDFTGGFGSASADIQFAQDIQRLDSWSVGIAGQYPLSERLNLGGNAGFDSEEFANFNRKRYSFKLYVSYRF